MIYQMKIVYLRYSYVKKMALHLTIVFTALLISFSQLACLSFAGDYYKLCTKCGLKIPKNEDTLNRFDINFCPACGNNLKQISFITKTTREKILELIKQKRRQMGDIRQLKASEWSDKGETNEDKIMKMACFINAIELDNHCAKIYNNLGVLYDEKLLTGEAITCFRKAVEIKPDYAEALNNLAKCLADSAHCEDAEAYYKKAIIIDPDNPIFHRNYADTLAKMKKIDESINEYKKSMELDKNGTSANIAAFKIDLLTRRHKLNTGNNAAKQTVPGNTIDKNKINADQAE